MPMMPARRCASCGGLVTSRRCPTCTQRFDRKRGSASHRGYCSPRWLKLRAQKLEQDPLCSICFAAGRHVEATEVDHLQRHRGPDDPLFWLWSNLDSKCKPCHSRKTASETLNAGHGDSTITSPRNDLDRVPSNVLHVQYDDEEEPWVGLA